MLGREPQRRGVVDRAAVRARGRARPRLARSIRARAGSPASARSAPGARQLVEIARALAGDARVVVMDEPTSSLSQPEAERLFEVIDRLRARGVGVIYISHFLEEVRRVADRYTVLRDGRSVDRGEIGGPGEEGLVARDSSRRWPAAGWTRPIRACRTSPASRCSSSTRCRVCGCPIAPGWRCTAARSSASRASSAPAAPSCCARCSVSIRFAADAIRVAAVWDGGVPPWSRLAQGVGLLSEDRKDEGLALGLSVADNLTLSRPPARFGFISGATRRCRGRRARRQALRCARAMPGSGGRALGRQPAEGRARAAAASRRRRAAARRADARHRRRRARRRSTGSMGELARTGKAVLFVSSYLPELLGVCDRIAVMSRGRLGEPRPAAEWSRDRAARSRDGESRMADTARTRLLDAGRPVRRTRPGGRAVRRARARTRSSPSTTCRPSRRRPSSSGSARSA